MAKEATYSMGKRITEMAGKPLRRKQDVILLLLNTIRMFELDEFVSENKKDRIAVVINKMTRIFYVLENKIFSVQFPFCVEMENGKIVRIYDAKTGVDIDSVLVSMLIGIFENGDAADCSMDFFFDELMRSEENLQDVSMEQMWEIVKHILTYDIGYIRYDYDVKHQKGLLHPVHHLDVCLDTPAAFKIGLKKSLDYDCFKDILDTTTNCYFLKV